MKKLTLEKIACVFYPLLIAAVVYTMMFMVLSVLFKSNLIGHLSAAAILAAVVWEEMLFSRSLRHEAREPATPHPRQIEVTDDDLNCALASVCDSQEEANLRFEKKIFGGLVMQVAEDHARTRCEGGVARQREMCDIPPASNTLLQTTTMINTIASGS